MKNTNVNGYTLLHKLGEGGMAEVWYAENTIKRPAAVKILKVEYALMQAVVSRFENEALVMVRLNHPNIRQVYDYNTIGNRPCIIMEYLEGGDLSAKMKKGERFSPNQLEKWWNQAVDALNYTHARGVVHRDIKPSNIFIASNGDLKLLDFGIAKIRDSVTLTQTGTRMGTLMYMSPEQIRDSKYLDYRSDIYSLAVTFVCLLTGKSPYDNTESSEFEIQTKIVSEPLDLQNLPGDWRNFLSPYLEKDAAKRPALIHFTQTAPPVSDKTALEAVGKPRQGSDKTINDKQPAPKPPAGKPGKKKSNASLWIAVAAAVALLLAVGWFMFNKKSPVNNLPFVAERDTSPLIYQDSAGMLTPIKTTDKNTANTTNDRQPDAKKSGADIEQEDYNAAKSAHTITAYENFTAKYPNSAYKRDINDKLADLYFIKGHDLYN
ncbi:MAG: protein kinase [Prevotellaceae bacterium]|jgi:serine/threonine-protein kinase|nr:protein kinase [Prevotellaceae bacterium]